MVIQPVIFSLASPSTSISLAKAQGLKNSQSESTLLRCSVLASWDWSGQGPSQWHLAAFLQRCLQPEACTMLGPFLAMAALEPSGFSCIQALATVLGWGLRKPHVSPWDWQPHQRPVEVPAASLAPAIYILLLPYTPWRSCPSHLLRTQVGSSAACPGAPLACTTSLLLFLPFASVCCTLDLVLGCPRIACFLFIAADGECR